MNNPTTRADLQNDGLVFKMANESVAPTGSHDFVSMASADYGAYYASTNGGGTVYAPTVSFTAVPEPATAAMAACGFTPLLARRRGRVVARAI